MLGDPPPASRRFGGWLESSMRSRGLTQAQLARSVGVADTQVSRWRRGQVVPTLQYLQRLADTFGVERAALDQLVGLPVAQARQAGGSTGSDPELEAELQAHQARLRQVLQQRLPRSMWHAYVEACVALADGLRTSANQALGESLRQLDPSRTGDDPPPERPLGFSKHP
jgi:transcriptional regulator with XRE-family HTH domain